MRQGLEANQESLLSTSSAFSVRDSLLLSNDLGLQAQKASNHIRKPMISVRSDVLLAAEAQREDADASKNPWLNAAVSSANSLCWGSSVALKESSESFTAREGSSQALSELDQSKGDSIFFYRTPSLSCIESSECYDSGVETTTRIDLNGKRLHCCKSKEVDARANHRGVSNARDGVTAGTMEARDHQTPSNTLDMRASTDIKVGVPPNVSTENVEGSQCKGVSKNRVVSRQRASSNKLEALDLLIYAAIQVGFLDDEDDQACNISLKHPKRTDRVSNVGPRCGYKDGFPVHLGSPILKKRVVRRARNAFFKQTGSNMLQRLGIASSAENLAKKLINVEKKVSDGVQKDDNFINESEANHTWQENRAVRYTQRSTPRVPSEQRVACKSDASEMLVMKTGDVSKHEVLQALPTDVCNAYLKGGQVRNRPCRKPMKQQKLQGLPPPELCGSLVKPAKSAVGSEMCKDLSQVEYFRRQKNGSLEEEEERECREANSEVGAQQLPTQHNHEGSVIRLKIRPMRLPSQIPQHKDILQGSEYVSSENQTVTTRKSKHLHVWEQESRADVTVQPMDSIQYGFPGSLDTAEKDVDVLKRSKRSRSQVLPTKFSDSVLQPWKRTYKKK